jgi:hypothetical protein
MSADKVKVGDELWCVNRYSTDHISTVTKVGSKWFTAGRSEYSLAPERDGSFSSKLSRDGSGMANYAWRSKEAYEEAMRQNRRRSELGNRIRDAISPFSGQLPLEQIEAAAKALGIEVPE